jgi:hypothetical protein
MILHQTVSFLIYPDPSCVVRVFISLSSSLCYGYMPEDTVVP